MHQLWLILLIVVADMVAVGLIEHLLEHIIPITVLYFENVECFWSCTHVILDTLHGAIRMLNHVNNWLLLVCGNSTVANFVRFTYLSDSNRGW